MTISAERCREILGAARRSRVLVVGDMVVDEHIIGHSTRLSREAPVPVIEQRGHLFVPGGAANLAYNARSLGSDVSVGGLVGDDEMGGRLRQILDEAGIHTAGLATEPSRPTSVKLRVWAGGASQRHYQQVARVDVSNREPMSEQSQQELILYLEGAIPEYGAVIISDYESGVVDAPILEYVLASAKRNGKLVIVDSHGDFARFGGVTAVTPNQPEAEAELGISMDDDKALESGGNELRSRLDCTHLLITLGGKGLALFSRGERMKTVEAHSAPGLVDATGAGDTVASAFALSLLGNADPVEAAEIANAAGAVVVSRLGASTARPDEVAALFGKADD